MGDDLDNWDVVLVRLKHSLQALAMPADIQFELYPDFVCTVDEVVLDFDHWCRCVLSNDRGELSEEQRAMLRKLDGTFERMSDGRSQKLWTEDALRNSPEWQAVRDTVKAALTSFGWSTERPPGYRHEYVPGADI